MNTLKAKRITHRFFGILECLLICLFTLWSLHTHEYIWAVLFATLALIWIYKYLKNYNNKEAMYGANYAIFFIMIMPCYNEYAIYKQDQRSIKYGLSYNKTRESLGIPIIPATWHIKDKWSKSINWEAKQGTIGHDQKYIGFDSLYKIAYERDEYNFKSINDTIRTISILFRYGNSKPRDSIFYWYNLKDTTLKISRHKADSLFNAANIKKDY